MYKLDYDTEIRWRTSLVAKTTLVNVPYGSCRNLAAQLLHLSTGESSDAWPALSATRDPSVYHVKLFYLTYHICEVAAAFCDELLDEFENGTVGLSDAFQALRSALGEELRRVQVNIAREIEVACAKGSGGDAIETSPVAFLLDSTPGAARANATGTHSEEESYRDETALPETNRIAQELEQLSEQEVKRMCFVEAGIPLRQGNRWLKKSELVPKLARHLCKTSRNPSLGSPSPWAWKADSAPPVTPRPVRRAHRPTTPHKQGQSRAGLAEGQDAASDGSEEGANPTMDSPSNRKRRALATPNSQLQKRVKASVRGHEHDD